MAKHLTLSDRIVIERGINNELTFATIARILERSPSSISREVKRYRVVIRSNREAHGNDCTKRCSCLRNRVCEDAPAHGCFMTRCKSCSDVLCTTVCPAYESPDCSRLDKPPYVCIGCDQQKKCRKNHAYYAAQRADTAYHRTIREAEEKTDHLEDILGTYLVKLTSTQLGENESAKATEYMKVIGDYERIADHAVSILESAEELVQKGIVFSDQAQKEYNLISDAVEDILDLSHTAFKDTDLKAARKTEPLEQIVDELKETLRTRHILRLQKGECSVDAGFVWSDLLTNLERVADHCSNISGCVLDTAGHTMNIHQNQRLLRNSGEDFGQELQELRVKYKI